LNELKQTEGRLQINFSGCPVASGLPSLDAQSGLVSKETAGEELQILPGYGKVYSEIDSVNLAGIDEHAQKPIDPWTPKKVCASRGCTVDWHPASTGRDHQKKDKVRGKPALEEALAERCRAKKVLRFPLPGQPEFGGRDSYKNGKRGCDVPETRHERAGSPETTSVSQIL